MDIAGSFLQTYSALCACGFRREGLDSQVAAEVVADRHESAIIRRAYQHDAVIVAEVR